MGLGTFTVPRVPNINIYVPSDGIGTVLTRPVENE